MSASGIGPIPLADPLPQPAPTLLLWWLLLVLSLLHLLAMNAMLGGSVIGAVNRLLGRTGRRPQHVALAAWFGKAMPVLITTTVTLGVAALLFVQAIYGRLLFTGAVLVGWFWLAVIPTLILAYGAAYRLAFAGGRCHPIAAQALSWYIAGSMLAIAFVYVTTMSFMNRPEQFVPAYTAGTQAWHLNLSDPTFLPRWLHMVLGALALGGLTVAHVGLARARVDAEFGQWAIRHGSVWFSVATALNIITGTWWLAALPQNTVLLLMGQDVLATLVLGGGIVLGLVSLAFMSAAGRTKNPAGRVRAASIAAVLSVALMVLTRDRVRTAALDAAGYAPQEWVEPQWGPILAFVVLLLMAVALIVAMVAALARSPAGAPPRDGTGLTG